MDIGNNACISFKGTEKGKEGKNIGVLKENNKENTNLCKTHRVAATIFAWD